ncbi:MAG TPA: hypothetical protein VFV17_10300, partial [Usitatibacteraceae bacterium]|nr:hypothetical protein [Usitatibacteraceae bacterium]
AIDSRQCEGRENCAGERRCMTHDLWQRLNDTILNYLDGVKLSDLVAEQRAKPAVPSAGLLHVAVRPPVQRPTPATT